jgi:hypothetical protein
MAKTKTNPSARPDAEDYEFEVPDLGGCCVCGKHGPSVRNIVMLDKRHPAPIPKSGCWGCFQCGLPSEGAVAVVCDRCLDAKRKLREACIGPPGDNVRIAIELLTVPFEHDISKHPEEA